MMTGLTDTFLDLQRTLGDQPADDLIAAAFANAESKTSMRQILQQLHINKDLNALPAAYQQLTGVLPVWADAKLMKAGAAFFARYADNVMQLLGLLSLPYCYTAADGAMVLYLSDRIRNDTAKRLMETAEFVWDVMAPNAFESAGKGFASILKVRLMHAAGRYYTLQGGNWDNAWGYPINQEDMAGTNLSFSFIVIRGLRKFGISISAHEQIAFIHLWNVIGSLLGLNQALLPQNGREALTLEDAIRRRQFKVSTHGQALTKSLTDYFASFSKDQPFSATEVLQLMRYLLGDEVADMLALPAAKLPDSAKRLLILNQSLKSISLFADPSSGYRQAYHRFRMSNL